MIGSSFDPGKSGGDAGEVCARLWATRQPMRVSWEHGIISRIDLVCPELAGECWIAPFLIDLQINGFAGIDFQQDDLTGAELDQAAAGLRAAGCGQFLVTLMTDDWDAMMKRLSHLRELRASSVALTAAIAGWHVEGPFLSAAPGFCGAHDPDLMRDPSLQAIRQLREITGTDRVLLTIAPERAGALEAIALAASLGIRVSLGHTDASVERLRQAVAAGATGFTHFGNACPQQLDRHDNILWRVLDTPGLTVSLIPDGIHVSPALFRLAQRSFLPSSIYYTTDAVAAAGAPPGRYTVGRHQVDVGPDQVVRQPGKTNYAGSGLQPIDGILRAADMLQRPWQEVWSHMSAASAAFMGWSHGLAVNQPANFCLLSSGGERSAVVDRVYTRGRLQA